MLIILRVRYGSIREIIQTTSLEARKAYRRIEANLERGDSLSLVQVLSDATAHTVWQSSLDEKGTLTQTCPE